MRDVPGLREYSILLEDVIMRTPLCHLFLDWDFDIFFIFERLVDTFFTTASQRLLGVGMKGDDTVGVGDGIFLSSPFFLFSKNKINRTMGTEISAFCLRDIIPLLWLKAATVIP